MLETIRFKFLIILFFYSLPIIAQENEEFGKLKESQILFTSYEKDTTASSVYLYEIGNNYFEVRNKYIQ